MDLLQAIPHSRYLMMDLKNFVIKWDLSGLKIQEVSPPSSSEFVDFYCYIMKCLSLNIRGFGSGKDSKIGWFKNLCRVEKPDLVLLQETKLRTVDLNWVCGLWGNQQCNFIQKEMVGKLGGQLLIWDMDCLNVTNSFAFDICVGIRGVWIHSRPELNVANVYGPHDDASKQMFWDQLHNIISGCSNQAWNSMRFVTKVKDLIVNLLIVERECSTIFIERAELLDLPLGGRLFTRISDDGLKFSKLDRFLINDMFHNAWNSLAVVALDRGKSDHCPIILKDDNRNFGPKPIKVFDDWLDIEGVDQTVKEVWSDDAGGGNRLDCRLRNKLKKTKLALKTKGIKSLVTWKLKAEKGLINDEEREHWLCARKEWFQREKVKVSMLKQKSRVRWILEGDENTKYFHSLIKRGYCKNNIRGLTINGLWCENPHEIKEAAYYHFKNIFEERAGAKTSLVDLNYPILSCDEATKLEAPISEEEIAEALHDCVSSKAPGPDGFNMRGEFLKGCNASFVTLVPKESDSISLSDFRPISLIGSFYKIVTKLLSNRLRKVIPQLIGSEQSAFLKERYILDGILVANESIEYMKKVKEKGIIFKVDFEKAFDSLNWDFLMEVMASMGFRGKWPAEGLNILTKAAVDRGIFKGIKIGRDKVVMSHLQYADDTMFFGEWSKSNARNLINILKCFELASGLKVNFHKSCLYGVGVNAVEIENLASRMGCQAGKFQFIYLGLPIGAKMKKLNDWQPVIDKFKKRLSD
ncbi:uncharacterized protein [Rutidosis leptorrhynchoides]|uniref:uncharacterized protein n=1 Tax=Rutidosis leptorrhynchoides TaxID=125765 RepID=UPI003A995F9B